MAPASAVPFPLPALAYCPGATHSALDPGVTPLWALGGGGRCGNKDIAFHVPGARTEQEVYVPGGHILKGFHMQTSVRK